jgi:kanamycin kinase/aminoglycoside 3'-phosphotransferase-3
VSGFLDLGNGGTADRWQDIALCVRSLRYNYVGYAGYDESDYLKYKELLFRELGIEPDEEKIRYYALLDELF